MKVLITGGAGYIGSHCNAYFSKAGIDTVVLDDLSDGHAEAVVGGRLVIGDIGNAALLNELFAAETVDAVIHFAAFASVPDSMKNPERYYRNNVVKMKALLDACVKHGVGYFIFSSSASTFGEPQYVPMDETHPQKPINPYGATKLMGEQMLFDYGRAYGIKCCALRYFCAAGAYTNAIIGEAHDPEAHLIPVMIKAAISGKPFKVFGTDWDTRDGSCIRDFIHVLDLAKAHYLSLKHIMDGNPSDCFNLGSGTGYSVLETMAALERVTNRSVPHILGERRDGDPAVLVASNEKAKRMLGWNPQYGLDDMLAHAWAWEVNRRY